MPKPLARVAIGLLLAAYAVMLVRHASFAAGGADSSGYLNEARMMARGQARLPIAPLQTLGLSSDWAHVFTPLGFVPAANSRAMVPSYPPGLPAHFALAAMVGGWAIAPFLIAPLAAIACLLLTFLLARQLGLDTLLAAASAGVLAASPVFLFISLQPMSDVVATAWTLAAMVCAIAAERRPAFAAAAGAAFAIGVCVRPTNILLAIALAFALRWKLRPLCFAVIGALPFGIALIAWQSMLYGSPFTTGYGGIFAVLEWQNLPPMLPRYVVWLATQLTPLIFPGALLIAFDRRLDWLRRGTLLTWFFVFFSFYCFYGPFDAWWYTRFLLPAIPPLIVGFFLLLRNLRAAHLVAGVAMTLIVAVGVMETRHFSVLHVGEGEAIYPEAVRGAERILPRDAIVLSMQFSGAILYYSDRSTVRWDELDHDRFQLLRAYAGNANLHWYALLAPFEWEEMKTKLPGKWTPVAKFRDVVLWRLDS